MEISKSVRGSIPGLLLRVWKAKGLQGKRSLIAVGLLLLVGVTVATTYWLRPAKVSPRVALADSAGFLTVGLGFSPDGQTFAGISCYLDENGGGCWGGPVRLWNVATGQERVTLLDNHTRLPDIRFSPKGDLLATEDGNGELRLWDVGSGSEWASFQVSKVASISYWRPNFRFSPDGRTLAFESQSEKGVTLWDLTSKREKAHLPGASSPLHFSPDSRILATAFDQSIRLWDVATGKEMATTHGRPVQALSVAFAPVAFAPDGRTLATATRKLGDAKPEMHQVILWDVSTGAEITAWDTEGEVRFLSFSPDGQVLSGLTAALRPVCWTMNDLAPAPPSLLPITSGLIPLIAPDQGTCAIQGPAGEITLWDLVRGKKKATFIVQDLAWTNGTCAFSPDAQFLAVGVSAMESDDWIDRLSQAVDPPPQGPLVTPVGTSGPVGKINAFGKFTPVTQTSGIKLLDVATGRVFATFEGATFGEFSPDGKMWAMHGADGTIKIWDVPAPKSTWGIVLWLLFGLLAGASLCWWWRRTQRQPQDGADSSS
jgi:WD40 repeat protein